MEHDSNCDCNANGACEGGQNDINFIDSLRLNGYYFYEMCFIFPSR